MKITLYLLLFFTGSMVPDFVKAQPLDGGTISTNDPQVLCGTSVKNSKIKVNVSGKKGKTFTFLSVDQNNIINVIQKSGNFNFSKSDPGTYLLYHVSYDKKDFNGKVGLNFSQLAGTFALSNDLEINITEIDPASIAFSDGSTQKSICTESSSIALFSEGGSGEDNYWVIIDKSKTIVEVSEDSSLDIGGLSEGKYSIFHISSSGDVIGMSEGSKIQKLDGCYALSNTITFDIESPEGGEISGDSLFFCIGNNSPDKIHGNDIRLSGESKGKGQWILTSEDGIIMDLLNNPHQPNFDDSDPGISLLWYMAGEASGLQKGENINDLEGCFDLSNYIFIVKTIANGGNLDHGIVKACITSDSIVSLSEDDFVLTDTEGVYFNWVVTTRNKTILGFGESLSDIDLSDAGTDKFFVYHLAYNDDLAGLEIGNRISDLSGCFDLSNQVPVNVYSAIPAILEGTISVGCDSTGAVLDTSGLTVLEGSSDKLTWLLVDSSGQIIFIIDDLSEIDPIDDLSGLTLHIINYNSGIGGLTPGGNISDITGCYALSNGVLISGNELDGGVITGGPFSFCQSGDDVFLPAEEINLSDNQGPFSTWVITETEGKIVGLVDDPAEYNFGNSINETYLLWHLSYGEGLSGLTIESNAADLAGCFDFSNSINIIIDSLDGGTLSGGPFSFCGGNNQDAVIPVDSLELSGVYGQNTGWIVTDTAGLILALPASPSEVDFNDVGNGTGLIWHIAYADGIQGLQVDSNAFELTGCFDLSNPVSLINEGGNGGTLAGGPFSFCVNDGIADTIPQEAISLADEEGENMQWVVTDTSGLILALPMNPSEVDFDSAVPGTCLIWHLSYSTGLEGLEIDSLVSDLEGCFNFSNSIVVNRGNVEGGIISGGPFSFCSGIESDTLNEGDISLTDAIGLNGGWVVTDSLGNILIIGMTPNEINYSSLGSGTFFLWHISYTDGLDGFQVANNISELDGCFDLSNSIEINNGQSNGGMLTGGPFSFCVGDTIADILNASEITLSDTMGGIQQWIIINSAGNIVALPDSIDGFSFESFLEDDYSLFNLTYDVINNGLSIGSSIENFEGCYDLSNPVIITLAAPMGGDLEGGPFNFCIGDGLPDIIEEESLLLTASSGGSDQWIITDTNGLIIDLPSQINVYDFELTPEGKCLIWNINYLDSIVGLEVDSNVANFEGCYDLSNSVEVIKSEVLGGNIEFVSGGTDTTLCVDDGNPDEIEAVVADNKGEFLQWLITNEEGNITSIVDTLPYNFEGGTAGTLNLWAINYNGPISGVEVDGPVANISGCFSLSNPLIINLLSGEACAGLGGLIDDVRMVISTRQNLVQDEAVIDIKYQGSLGRGNIFVRNMEGMLLMSVPVEAVNENQLTEIINTSQLENGVFFITVRFPGAVHTLKFVKQK